MMPKHKNGLIADLLYKVETAVHLTHFFDVNEILLAKLRSLHYVSIMKWKQ